MLFFFLLFINLIWYFNYLVVVVQKNPGNNEYPWINETNESKYLY